MLSHQTGGMIFILYFYAMKIMWAVWFCLALIVVFSCKHLPGPEQKTVADSLAAADSTDPQIKALTEKIKKDPRNPDNYFIRGNVFSQLNNLRAAHSDLSKAISLDSTNLNYYFSLADVYLRGGSADRAIDVFNAIIRLDPKNTDAMLKLSKVYYYKKDYSHSLEQLAKAQDLDKENSEVYFIRGMNLKEMGDTMKAIVSFQKAVQVKPDFYDAYMQLGLLTSKNPGSIAAQYFDNAIRIDSTSTEAYYDKGKFYQDHKSYEKAKGTYHELILKNPQYEKAYFNLGFIYIQQDSIDKAYRMFDYAVKVSPAYAEAFYYRGLCSLAKGNTEQAASDFRQALTLKPNYEMAQKELNNLTQKSD